MYSTQHCTLLCNLTHTPTPHSLPSPALRSSSSCSASLSSSCTLVMAATFLNRDLAFSKSPSWAKAWVRNQLWCPEKTECCLLISKSCFIREHYGQSKVACNGHVHVHVHVSYALIFTIRSYRHSISTLTCPISLRTSASHCWFLLSLATFVASLRQPRASEGWFSLKWRDPRSNWHLNTVLEWPSSLHMCWRHHSNYMWCVLTLQYHVLAQSKCTK